MAAQQKRPRPSSATDAMLKLHRRTMVLDGRVYTVVSLRPGSDFRFATNYFHDTWHVLSDWRGARVLARLLWGLAYQRRPGTLIVIDPAQLDTNPFDGAPSDPIVVVPSDLTVFTSAAAAALRRRLPFRDRSAGTVRWQTFGLDSAVDALAAERAMGSDERYNNDYAPQPTGWLRVDRIGGLITIFAAADQLRDLARTIATMGNYPYRGMAYQYLDYPETNGEVQISRQYRNLVTSARRARIDIVGRRSGPITEEAEHAIWSHAATLRRNRLRRLADHAPN
ncbi:hypothetical protein [Nocardia altamirensis]|uniref:hypothetical protein n=1 Tax=Nocardia altamirensis TaxID=472158 RepID=UPI000A059271|nr:hypothetical protein [Nocardia altamirensis]